MSEPWRPAPYDDADLAAYRALSLGEASADQQRRVFRHLVEVTACTYDISFRDDRSGGERATAFAEGKRFVGLQVLKLSKLVPSDRRIRTDRDPDRRAGG